MKKVILSWLFFFAAAGFECNLSLPAQERPARSNGSFYEKSLHYTDRGQEYWYAKEHGGLERITGIPFSQLGCDTCHVRSCDTCHASAVAGKPAYSADSAVTEAACLKCHGMESLTYARKNPRGQDADVHFAGGMKCMGCHSAREIHGDGTSFDSMQAPGVLDTRCEKCHSDLSKCPSNAVHKGKLDCGVCHVRDVPSCFNCHFDTKVSEKKSVSLPLKNIIFLINQNGKVKLANLHTFIYQNRTMIVFAPAFSHWIMKEGRRCEDCHATQVIKEMQAGTLKPVVWENGGLRNATGIIPVLDGFDWNFVFLNYVGGQWAPAGDAARPLLNYSGYSQPITKEQFARLARPQSPRR